MRSPTYCLISCLIIARCLVGVMMTSHPQRQHIGVFQRNQENILLYIKLRNIANTLERLKENNNTAHSEAWFAYHRETDSSTRIKIQKIFGPFKN